MPAYGPGAPNTAVAPPSGNWFSPLPGYPVAGGAAYSSAGDIGLLPFNVQATVVIKALGLRISTGSAGNAAVGIYADNPTTGRPTGVALGTVSSLVTTTATTVSGLLGATLTLTPGRYWMAAQMDNTTAVLQTVATSASLTGAMVGAPTLAQVTISATNVGMILNVAGTYPTLPDMTGATFVINSGTRTGLVWMQVN